MKKNTYIVLTFIISLNYCFAQGGFKRSFKLPNAFNNSTRAVFETTAGNYLVAGIVFDTLNNYYTNRLTLVGLNSQGRQQWTKKYGNVKFQYLDNIFLTKWFYKQGNYLYHAGCVLDSNNIYLGVLLKFNFNGDTLWQRKFYEAGYDVIPQQVVGSADGGFLITGFFQNSSSSLALLIKTDANGFELWRKKIHKPVPDVQDGKVILQDSATKKIVTVGYQYIGNAQSWYLANNILIFDSLGNKLHQLSYSSGYSNLWDMIQTKDKNIIVIGQEYQGKLSGSIDSYKSYAVKFNINNPTSPIWSLRFDNVMSGNYFSSIVELPNEDVLIAGTTSSSQENNQLPNGSSRLTRITKNGNVVWNKYYNYRTNVSTINAQQILSINKTSDGGFISAIDFTFDNPNKFFVVKFDSTGCDSSAFYCSTVGLKNNSFLSENISVYPNPTTGSLNIEAENATKVQVVSMLGQLVKEEELKIENKKIDIGTLQNGVYFLKVFDKDKLIGTTKIIKE